jgi:hypothetical protein
VGVTCPGGTVVDTNDVGGAVVTVEICVDGEAGAVVVVAGFD